MCVEAAGAVVFTGSLVIFVVGFPITMLLLPFLLPIGALGWSQSRQADRVRRGLEASAYGILSALALVLGGLLIAGQIGADEGPTSIRAWTMLAVTGILTAPSAVAAATELRHHRPPSASVIATAIGLALATGIVAAATLPSRG